MQVLSMTQDQINGLPDAERAAILQLVRAFRLCRNLFNHYIVCLAHAIYGNARRLIGLRAPRNTQNTFLLISSTYTDMSHHIYMLS